MNELTTKALNFLNLMIESSEPIKYSEFNYQFELKPDWDKFDKLVEGHIIISNQPKKNIYTLSTISMLISLLLYLTGDHICIQVDKDIIVGFTIFTGEVKII